MRHNPFLCGVILAAAASTAAAASSRLLALRVEATPLRAGGAGTVMSIAVQVAPEDRARLGQQAWLRAELSREERTVDRIARPVAVDAEGRAAVEVQWPPGRYRLRVDVESAGGGETGFWVMDLEVPTMVPPGPAPAPASASASAPGSDVDSTAVPEPEPEVTTAPAAASGVPAPRTEEPATATPTARPPAVPPPPAEEIAERPPAPEVPPSPAATPVEQASAAGIAPRWSPPDSGELDVTVAAGRDGRALLGLAPADLRVRAGGAPAADLTMAGGPGVPLEVALVVAVAGSGEVDAAAVGESLARTAARGTGAVGGITLVTGASGARRLGWDEAAGELASLVAAAGTGSVPDLPSMVGAALDGLGERAGRRFVLVVSDGRDTGSRGAWRELERRAAIAAAPILVTGLWGPDFDARVRGRLSDLAAASGGSAFFVQGLDRLRSALEENGDLVTASRLVRLARPAGATGPVTVRVEPVDPAVTVLAPAAVP